jgi:hypothetical protein
VSQDNVCVFSPSVNHKKGREQEKSKHTETENKEKRNLHESDRSENTDDYIVSYLYVGKENGRKGKRKQYVGRRQITTRNETHPFDSLSLSIDMKRYVDTKGSMRKNDSSYY